MKVLRKAELIKMGANETQHVTWERKVLSEIDSSFSVKFYGSFQDDHHLYLILEFAVGGEVSSTSGRE